MYPTLIVDVDPLTLRLPTSRRDGVDLYKYQHQVARFGTSTTGMPLPICHLGADGVVMIMDGVTRATRVAKLLPGAKIKVEIVEVSNFIFAALPSIGDKLP